MSDEPNEITPESEGVDITDRKELGTALNGGVPTDDLFDDESTIPDSDWVKFETIGDGVQGRLFEEPQTGIKGKFGDQNVYTIETADGSLKMVGLNPQSHVRAVRQLKQAEVGDIVAFKYTGDYDSGKGFPGKSIDVRIRKGFKE